MGIKVFSKWFSKVKTQEPELKSNPKAIGCGHCKNHESLRLGVKICNHRDAEQFKRFHRDFGIGCPGFERKE